MNILNDQPSAGNFNQRISELEEKINKYSRVSHYILITGERGTGKTTMARRLHEHSPRSRNRFVNLNCASLTEPLLESELFGYEKGAFTGAGAAKAGLFEIAGGGTLFLDEIGELPLNLQSKLLKAVEEKCIRRVGSSIERPVDTRIITATSRDLQQMVAEGSFRADLFDRLNILRLETIPLKFQREKIKELVQAGLDRECASIERNCPFKLSPEAIVLLENYDWPGNFRELLNFTTRLAVECLDESVIGAQKIAQVLGEQISQSEFDPETEPSMFDTADPITESASVTESNPGDFADLTGELVTVTFNPETDDLDRIYLKAAGNVITHVLRKNKGNWRKAARALGANHMTLTRIMTKYNSKFEVQNLPSRSPAVQEFASVS